MSVEWVGALAVVLVDSSARIVFVAALVAVVLLTARVRSQSVRHAAWTSVLCAMLLMPVLPRVVPSIELTVPTPLPRLEEFSVVAEPEARNRRATSVSSNTPADAAPATAVGPIPRGEEARQSAIHPAMWPAVAFVIYLMGVMGLLVRLVVGWRAMSRLAREASPTSIPQVYESDAVATPLLVGVLSPRIILPHGWRSWPGEKLRAILTHEREHIARRDPLIALLAHVNRPISWFHPLAWWLERTIAASAEQACDAAAVRATGERRRYAETLLEMADTVRRHRGRLAATTVYRANIALGAHALREGDRERAVQHMREAVKAPPSERLAAGPLASLDQRLVNDLLKEGERDSVADFLEASARLRTAARERLLRDASAIRGRRVTSGSRLRMPAAPEPARSARSAG